MKKSIKYIKNKLYFTYDLTQEHIQVLYQVYANEGVAEFENRDPNLFEDTSGNSLSWRLCDELVELGLLEEDEEAYSIFFEITGDGNEVIKQIALEH